MSFWIFPLHSPSEFFFCHRSVIVSLTICCSLPAFGLKPPSATDSYIILRLRNAALTYFYTLYWYRFTFMISGTGAINTGEVKWYRIDSFSPSWLYSATRGWCLPHVYPGGGLDVLVALRTLAQRRGAVVAGQEVAAGQEDGVDGVVMTHPALQATCQLPVLLLQAVQPLTLTLLCRQNKSVEWETG